MSAFDCQKCGACCCNTRENLAEGYRFYVEIEPACPLLRSPALARWVVYDEDGTPHLRTDPSGRCSALVGRLGSRVSCKIYAHRPRPCRRVTAGDDECRAARIAYGIL